VFLVFAIGCAKPTSKSFYDLVNNHFLNMVDTIAYKTGRLIQIPNDTSSIISDGRICILIDTAFNNSEELKNDLLTSVRREGLGDFEELILGGKVPHFESIDMSMIKHTGRYVLVNSKSSKELACSVTSGEITFYEPYITQDLAIIVFSISESPKAGFTRCWLFRNHNQVWEKIKTIELQRW
jgi:hypothetical protein